MKYKNKKHTNSSKVSWIYHAIKRLFDLVASFVLVIILALPLLIIGCLIKLDSKGPMVFKDNRVGKNNKDITILKFRTMYKDAESNIDKYLNNEQKESWLKERKIENDPRVTKIGRKLRKTSIDELPQIFNVFTGRLSFVGPRPITREELDNNFTNEQIGLLLSCKPGITGYWQVCGRNDAEFATGDRQKLELEYVEKRSLLLDLKILFLTIPTVLKHKGVK